MKPATDIDADFSEATPPEHLEAIRQEHEAFLSRLEALAVMAIAKGYWDEVYDHISSFPDAPGVDDGLADPIEFLRIATNRD